MRRCFIVFLLLLVQLQSVWGAAAAYCAHEASVAAASHFGHHEDRHRSSVVKRLSADDDGESLGLSAVDCWCCHVGFHETFPGVATFVGFPQGGQYLTTSQRFNSHVPSFPDRPDRIPHVAAA